MRIPSKSNLGGFLFKIFVAVIIKLMQIIPGINCSDSKCLREKIKKLEDVPSDWIHIDIADGKFAPIRTWNKPEELISLRQNIEVHLMVEDPEKEVDKWIKVGAKRIIIHLEVLKKGNSDKILNYILEKCSENDMELGIALNPETSIDELIPYLDVFLFVQILSVKPGFSGQEFNEEVIEKIEFLRERAPDIDIEVDGGVNPEVAKLVINAGANILVSTSYILENKDSVRAFNNLKLAAETK